MYYMGSIVMSQNYRLTNETPQCKHVCNVVLVMAAPALGAAAQACPCFSDAVDGSKGHVPALWLTAAGFPAGRLKVIVAVRGFGGGSSEDRWPIKVVPST